jgi:hypothetical protein
VRGQPLTADQWNAVIDCLRRLNPIAGQGIRIRETAQGVVLDSAAVATAVQRQEEVKTGAPAPFTLLQFGTDEKTGKPKWGLYAGSRWEGFKYVDDGAENGRTVKKSANLVPPTTVTNRDYLMVNEHSFWDVSAEVNAKLSDQADSYTYIYAERSLKNWPSGDNGTAPTYSIAGLNEDPLSSQSGWEALGGYIAKKKGETDGDCDARVLIARIRAKEKTREVSDGTGGTKEETYIEYEVVQRLTTHVAEEAEQASARIYYCKTAGNYAPGNCTDITGKPESFVDDPLKVALIVLLGRTFEANGTTTAPAEMLKAFAVAEVYPVALHAYEHLPDTK